MEWRPDRVEWAAGRVSPVLVLADLGRCGPQPTEVRRQPHHPDFSAEPVRETCLSRTHMAALPVVAHQYSSGTQITTGHTQVPCRRGWTRASRRARTGASLTVRMRLTLRPANAKDPFFIRLRTLNATSLWPKTSRHAVAHLPTGPRMRQDGTAILAHPELPTAKPQEVSRREIGAAPDIAPRAQGLHLQQWAVHPTHSDEESETIRSWRARHGFCYSQ